MNLKLTDWITLTESINKIKSLPSFAFKRYFEPNSEEYTTTKVMVDVEIGGQKLAPLTRRGNAAKVMGKPLREAQEITPPQIRIKESLTPNNFRDRPVGANIYVGNGKSGMAEARKKLIGKTQKELRKATDARIEFMCHQALGGKITYFDGDIQFDIDYQMPAANKPVLLGGDKWSDSANSDPLADIRDWKNVVQEAIGAEPTEAHFTRNVTTALMNNEKFMKALDTKRATSGVIDVNKLADENGTRYIGSVEGVDLYEYNQSVIDIDGTKISLVPETHFRMIAPNAANFKMHYAAIEDLKAGLVAMKHFSKMYETEDPSGLWILSETDPLPVPHCPEAIIDATVL